MKVKLNTSICEIIRVGMYESLLDPRYLFDDDECIVKHSKALKEEEKDYFFEQIGNQFDLSKYRSKVADYAMEAIKDYLDSVRHIANIKTCGRGEIISPREYNFSTDEPDFYVEVEESELNRVFTGTIDDKQFWEWATKYKSCSGFISLMPWTKSEFAEAIQGKDISRALGMCLTYLFEKKHNFVESEFDGDYSIFEKLKENHNLMEFVDDEKAQLLFDKAYMAYHSES